MGLLDAIFPWGSDSYRYDRIQRARNGITVLIAGREIWIHKNLVKGRKVIIYPDWKEIAIPFWLARKTGLI